MSLKKEYKLAIKIAGKVDKSLNNALSGASSGMKKLFKVAAIGAAAVVAVGSALAVMGVKTANAADAIDKGAQKLGMSTKAYQSWKYVLNQSGMDITALTVGMKKFNSAITDTSSKGSQDLQTLGVNIKGLSQEEAFDKTITALQGMKDQTMKAKYASDLFGKGGQKLLPLLNKSAKQTQALKDRAKELGLIMSDKAVKGSAEFKEGLEELDLVGQGLRNNFMGAILPKLVPALKAISSSVGAMSLKIANANGNFAMVGSAFGSGLDKTLEMILGNAPKFIFAAGKFVVFFAIGIIKSFPKLAISLYKMINKGLDSIDKWNPKVSKHGASMIGKFAAAIVKAIPKVLFAINKLMLKLLVTWWKFIAKAIPIGLKIVLSFAAGMIRGLPSAIKAGVKIVSSVIKYVVSGKWAAAGWKVVKKFVRGIVNALKDSKLVSAVKSALKALFTIKIHVKGKKISGTNVEVTTANHAAGGVFRQPTLLPAFHRVAESGAEAILPLRTLWSKMTDVVRNAQSSTAIPALAGAGSYGGMQITYSPNYTFGGTPTSDDLTAAEDISQKKFKKLMDQYVKDKNRTKF